MIDISSETEEPSRVCGDNPVGRSFRSVGSLA
jgi:hypothetical protein